MLQNFILDHNMLLVVHLLLLWAMGLFFRQLLRKAENSRTAINNPVSCRRKTRNHSYPHRAGVLEDIP